MNRRPPLLATLLVAAALAISLSSRPGRTGDEATDPGRPRRIVFVIADGTGWQQWGLLLVARRAAGRTDPTNFERMLRAGALGTMTTWPSGDVTTESAAAATALATGAKVPNGMVSMTVDGRPLRTLLETARGAGWATGALTDVNITDATPAAFLAHAPSRRMEDSIAARIANGSADLAMGGGAAWFTPAGEDTTWLGSFGEGIPAAPSRRRKGAEEDALDWVKVGPAIRLFTAREELGTLGHVPAAVRPDETGHRNLRSGGPVLGLFAPAELPWAIDRDTPEERAALDAPTLAEMTATALRHLSAGDRSFVLMVEAGLVDRACHFHDAGAALAELESLDETLGLLLETRAKDPSLLVVLAADHETGGLSVGLPSGGADARDRVALLYTQLRSLAALPGARRGSPGGPPTLEQARAACPWLPDDARPFVDPSADGRTGDYVGTYAVAWAEAASAAAGVVFATDNHSATPVPVVAVGPGAHRFAGLLDNTSVAEHLRDLLLGN